MTSALVEIPDRDHELVARLPDDEKARLDLRMRVLSIALLDAQPYQALKDALSQYSWMPGMKFSTMRKIMDQVRAGAGWQALVDRRRLAIARTKTKQFDEFWKGKCCENQRGCKQAYRDLLRDFRAGEFIDGVGTWITVWRVRYPKINPPARCPDNFLPEGWTYQNLMKKAPNKFERTASRQGRGAAARFRPLVLTTRVGLKPGQMYVFDDVEHDVKVNFVGINYQATRPIEIGCEDLFSACRIDWGVRPTVITPDGKKEKSKEREMRFLLAKVLTQTGYREDGTLLLVEHGTAAIRERLERDLFDWSKGAIRVDRSGREFEPAYAALFEGRKRGNFRFKACLESAHNLIHNATAMLPGQTGKDRDHSPEELHGRDAYNTAVIRAAMALPAERRELLRMPFLEFTEFVYLLEEIYHRINSRTDHKLEGWVKAGLVTHEFRMAEHFPWQPVATLLDLPPEQQQVARSFIDRPGLSRTRNMSPQEVWSAGAGELIRLPSYMVPRILGPEEGVPRPVQDNGTFEFEDRDISSEPLIYFAEARSPAGYIHNLVRGEKYLTYVNPFNPTELFVCEGGAREGAYIGICRAMHVPCKADAEAVKREMGRAAHQESELLKPLAKRGAKLIRAKAEMHEHNATVFAGGIPGADTPLTIAHREQSLQEKAELARLALHGKQYEEE